jgi:hypothetical protein
MDGRVQPGHDEEKECRKFFHPPCRPASPPFVYWPEHHGCSTEFGEQAMSIIGSSEALGWALSVINLPCSALMTVPPTSFVGAILWTGHLGNFVATHLSIF